MTLATGVAETSKAVAVTTGIEEYSSLQGGAEGGCPKEYSSSQGGAEGGCPKEYSSSQGGAEGCPKEYSSSQGGAEGGCPMVVMWRPGWEMGEKTETSTTPNSRGTTAGS